MDSSEPGRVDGSPKNISENNGGTDVFFNFFNCSIFLRFQNSDALIEEYQRNGIHHIRGEAPLLTYQLFFRGKMKVQGLLPSNLVNHTSSWYLDIRGLLF